MQLLLPNRFKKIGAIIAPLGFALWVLMQRGFVTLFLTWLFGKAANIQNNPPYYIANVLVAAVSFFSLLGGLYFIVFSKEKIEDELIQKTRLDSFQFAAFIQIISIIAGFLTMFLFKEPDKEGMMLFFVALISIFWLSFLGRFNYILHVKLK